MEVTSQSHTSNVFLCPNSGFIGLDEQPIRAQRDQESASTCVCSLSSAETMTLLQPLDSDWMTIPSNPANRRSV